ncbi:hypothetical protein M408DRAFT_233891 [Serendipita vermifera MAFF 305830]|uniref:Uncharacterized protein n=1 Tax=Serendipita vermifera MAFF 305830 TaxID=933852 RepID=A0A0C3AWB0_SERVB|nr:hypothetical protein M408DRAFT_233891 [Serendipita vermifera MAFF 305830]
MHFYGWKKGLKTGMYYLRTRPAAAAIQFTVDQTLLNKVKEANSTEKSAAPGASEATGIKSPTSAVSPTGNSLANGLNGVKRAASNGPTPSWMDKKRNASSSGVLSPTSPTKTPDAEMAALSLASPPSEEEETAAAAPSGAPDTTAATGTATAVTAPSVSFDGTDKEARAAKAAAEDPEFAAALARQRERELEEAKLMCSIENKEACLMCSG